MKNKWPSDEEIKRVLDIAENADAARPLPKNADAVDRLKHRLCREILIYKHKHGLSHEELGEMLGIDKTEVSRIVNYHIDRYTIDKLYRLALKLLPDLSLDLAA